MYIETKIIEITWLGFIPHGYGCGYIGLPKDHPWFGKNEDSIDASVHGGLTYAANHLPQEKPGELWWIGFDCAHGGDTQLNCPKSYVEEQVESLKQQAIEVCQSR